MLTAWQALHTHGRRLRVSMEGDAVSPRSPAATVSPRAADAFHNLQRTSWEQQRNRSFDSARGRTQVWPRSYLHVRSPGHRL